MAMSSWMIRHRSQRQRSRPPPEDCYRLDTAKSSWENATDIYRVLSARAINENKRLSLLNGLVKLIERCKKEKTLSNCSLLVGSLQDVMLQERDAALGYSSIEWFYCISASLVHQFTQIRAAALRAIRHLLMTPSDVRAMNDLQIEHLICRSLDVLLKNEEERVQALKLIRKQLVIAPELVSPAVVRCLVSLGESGAEDRMGSVDREDRMLRACLATLCELGVLNPKLLIVCGGVSVITRNVLECHSPRIAESLCGVLLHLLEWPKNRHIAGVRLDCLAAPYCDFSYRLGIMDKNKDARDLRFTCSRLALLSVLRSWVGTIEFCNPAKPSGLKAIIDILYLNQLEVRKAVLDLLYELLGLPQPGWTDEYSVALSAVDPSEYQDSWRLNEGFVAAEGTAVLPSLASRVPNISDIHLALLLYCFIENGLLNALVEVIISSDTFISVRATILLGKVLHQMHQLLPEEICNSTPTSTLPSLISKATEGNHQAKAAIAALQQFHQMLQNRPASCSLFLDCIIQSGELINTRMFKRELSSQEAVPLPATKYATLDSGFGTKRTRHDSVGSTGSSSGGGGGVSGRLGYLFTGSLPLPNGSSMDDSTIGGERGMKPQSGLSKRSSFKRVRFLHIFDNLNENERLIKDSNVLGNKDANVWDWDIVITIFRSDSLGNKLDDQNTRFIRRIIEYFKPSNNRFSHQDLTGNSRQLPAYVTAALELIDWLQQSEQELECIRILTDLFTDISRQLLAIHAKKSAHECLFSPQHMTSTMCQQYFLLIGRMCRTEKGLSVLTNTDVFKELTTIVTKTNHLCYVKLIVSGLDYTLEGEPRKILMRALLKHPSAKARLYATQFLRVLLRARLPNFEVWGIPLLLKLVDESQARCVQLAALEILEEACYERAYLEELVNVWPNLERMSDHGKLVTMKFYSIPRGLNHPKAKIQEEIELWVKVYNKRYVLMIEADVHAHLTQHTKTEDGTYSRRHCTQRTGVAAPNMLPHLYSQLVQTNQGLSNLQMHGDVENLIETMMQAKCNTEREVLSLKAALWALGHFSTSKDGVTYLGESRTGVYERLIHLAMYAEVYSVRATALNCLCLVATTQLGADILHRLNWIAVRHDRNTSWPVYEREEWFPRQMTTPVRHNYSLAPYNYTALLGDNGGLLQNDSDEQQLIVSRMESTSVGEDQSDCAAVSSAQNASLAPRSRTLPEGVLTASRTPIFQKHKRSLSESKTTDGISLMTAFPPVPQTTIVPSSLQMQPPSRIRYNSGTDSNTSGVSSYESIVGGRFHSDMMQQSQLSPIPSSSNLIDLKKLSSEEKYRRISLSGIPLRKSNMMSAQDLHGYHTLRILRRRCRPMLSESAADELAEIMDDTMASVTSSSSTSTISRFRLRASKSLSEQQRKLRVRSLDRNSGVNAIMGYDDFRKSLRIKHQRLQGQAEVRGPCYSGICLPRNILDLFPLDETNGTYVSNFTLNELEANTYSGDVNCCKDDFGGAHSSSILIVDRESADSLKLLRTSSMDSTGTGHLRDECLQCCRPRNAPSATSSSSRSECFNSSENSFSDDGDRIRASILLHVQRMANPVWSKQSRMQLLDLKQKHASAFQDVCLYSEVCHQLGRNTYRLGSRRFLQELFLDLDFDSFYREPGYIASSKGNRPTGNETLLNGLLMDGGSASPIVTKTSESNLTKNGSATSGRTSTVKVNNESSNKQTNSTVEGRSNSVSGIPQSKTKKPYPPATAGGSGGSSSNSTSSNSGSNDSVSALHNTSGKTHHMRSPPLASLYETSVENLAEMSSTPKAKPSLRVQATLGQMEMNQKVLNRHSIGTDVPDGGGGSSGDSSTKEPPTADPATASRKAVVTCDEDDDPSSCSSCSAVSAPNQNTKYKSRPRFNTLELDLSCTKNKFPIRRDRAGSQRNYSDYSPITPTSAAMAATTIGGGTAGIVTTFGVTMLSSSSNSAVTSPTGGGPLPTLFCEQRLQQQLTSSKSEAALVTKK
ncbi:rapamycin-insensitive companion of mTOR [Topomyia yanbarensis]|uniref:rapamycin-insensitive companion of mTOR n=1 Tax=Topomyia yanbarensis TaxID=2498891 RepID=UPI00273B68BE|nr:rapamycin-insensitive companion of mTOR [Topomyia yanbarensis]